MTISLSYDEPQDGAVKLVLPQGTLPNVPDARLRTEEKALLYDFQGLVPIQIASLIFDSSGGSKRTDSWQWILLPDSLFVTCGPVMIEAVTALLGKDVVKQLRRALRPAEPHYSPINRDHRCEHDTYRRPVELNANPGELLDIRRAIEQSLTTP